MNLEQREAALRLEVRRFAAGCGTRRSLPDHVHVGRLDGARLTLPAGAAHARGPRGSEYDAALRADLVTRMLDGLTEHDEVVAWLTRGGFPTAGDQDLGWLASTEMAFSRHGRSRVPFYVITRHGWLEVRTGEGRSWRRVRRDRGAG